MANYTVQTIYQIWDNETTAHIEVTAPEKDSLLDFEIRYVDGDGKTRQVITLTYEQVLHVTEVLKEAVATRKGVI
jgi:hypothetical protein